MRYLAILALFGLVGLVGLVGCEEGPMEPVTLDRVDPSMPNTGLIAFNDAAQALWSENDRAFLWDGTEVRQLPFRGIDLGPGGAVIGEAGGVFFHWRDGEAVEIPRAYGIDANGRVYVRTTDGYGWWTPEIGFSPAPGPTPSRRFSAVGEDGSIILTELIGSSGTAELVYFRLTRDDIHEIGRSTFEMDVSVTESGFIRMSFGGTTRVIERVDPWAEREVQFGSQDMNDFMIFVRTDNDVVNAGGVVLRRVDGDQALINNNNAVLVMSSGGEIRILR